MVYTYAALEAEYDIGPAPDLIPATNWEWCISILQISDYLNLVPDAVAIIDPLPTGFSPDVFSIASDAYLIAA